VKRAPDAVDWAAERREMVERQIQARGIRDARVLDAMLRIPRERFIPEENRHLSYTDDPVPIGFGQTISQPYMTALMCECLELKGTESVLEVGAGCGYHAAVLGALAARVVSLEILPELAAVAERNLAKTGLGTNVVVACADGSRGWPEGAPFDAISVAAGAPQLPGSLLDQLQDPGILVIPTGSSWEQDLRVIAKRQGVLQSRTAARCRFVPLRGSEGWDL
jgi:protein-L-isoaspartate(D-aspartate) O-methyltransferase